MHASETAQRVKALTGKPDNPNSISRTHMAEVENQFSQVPHMYLHMINKSMFKTGKKRPGLYGSCLPPQPWAVETEESLKLIGRPVREPVSKN